MTEKEMNADDAEKRRFSPIYQYYPCTQRSIYCTVYYGFKYLAHVETVNFGD